MVAEATAVLATAGMPFELLHPGKDDAPYWQWLQRTFPWTTWGRIDWPLVPGSLCRAWNSLSDLCAAFETLCALATLHNPRVFVGWSNAAAPGLLLDLVAARLAAAELFTVSWDTWLLCPSEGWTIEVFHEGEICFGHIETKNTRPLP